MLDEPLYVRRRLRELRTIIQNASELSHSGTEHQAVVALLDDLADDLARKSRTDYKKVYFFIIRCMGALAKRNAEEAYRQYGYINPFDEVISPSVSSPTWRWPVVNHPPSFGHASPDPTQWRDFSALKMYGYTVGKTDGWPQKKREDFLSDFLEMDLPPQVALHFNDEYATPLSAGRLRKVANIIATNASNFYRNDPKRYAVAISDWETDLAFLKKKYYDGMGLKFQPWPQLINLNNRDK